MVLSPEEKFILGNVKIVLSHVDICQLNDLLPLINNWDKLVEITVERGIGPLMYKNIQLLDKELVPYEVIDSLKQAYYLTLRRGMVLYEAYRKIVDKLADNNIKVIALKGIFLSDWLYGDIALRQFSDIDLLLRPEDGVKGVTILREMGYVSKEEKNISDFVESKYSRVHFAPMILDMVSVELHTKLHRMNEVYNVRPEDCWEKAIKVKINRVDCYGLHIYDLLIHVCIHLDKHFKEGQIQFNGFIDIVNILNNYNDLFDWKEFIQRCKFFKCENVVLKYIMLTNKYFQTELSSEIVLKYNKSLEDKDEELFIRYLHGYCLESTIKTSIPIHLENLKKINSTNDYVKYLLHVFFPPRQFMIEEYNLKYPGFFFFYYPYRYWIGLKGIIHIIRNKA